jgi:hypothetical protein
MRSPRVSDDLGGNADLLIPLTSPLLGSPPRPHPPRIIM